MKRLILYFILLLALDSEAQNWNVFNKSYRYNYVYDNNQLITNVLFADSIKQSGADTIYYMNRIGVECNGTCPTITTAITTTATVIVPNMPQFLQRAIVKKADETVLLQDTANWLIKPKCVLNEIWTFDGVNSKTAQCVSIATISIFNVIDSLKTIIIDGTDSLLISKKFGIIQFPNVYGKNKYYRLVGIEKAISYDVNSIYGTKVPNAWDFYNFDIGDKFCYSNVLNHVAGSSNSHYSTSWQNIEITAKKVNLNFGLYYMAFKKTQTHSFGYGPAPNGSYSSQTFTAATTTLSYNCVVKSIENVMYPGQIIKHCPQCSNNYFNNIVKFGKDNLGKFYKYAGPNCQLYSNIASPNASGVVSSYDLNNILLPTSNNESFTNVFGVGLGKVTYVLNYSFGYTEKNCLTCAFKNGTLYLGEELDVGVNENKNHKLEVSIFPNPTSESLIIELGEAEVTEIKMISIVGQTIKSVNNFESDKISIDLKDQATGIYFLQIYNEGKLIDVKKVIKN